MSVFDVRTDVEREIVQIEFEDMEEDDKEWLIDLAKILGRSDELPQEE